MSKSNKKIKQVYIPGKCNLDKDETLVRDPSVYEMYHHLTTVEPCLSFDVIPDDLGDNRKEFPHFLTVVGGTQSKRKKNNFVIVMTMKNLGPEKSKNIKLDEDDSSADDSDVDESSEPELQTVSLKHHGGVNRIKVNRVHEKILTATWSETGKVRIWNLQSSLLTDNSSPIFTFHGHREEGFALDWSLLKNGYLLTGDCDSLIYLWSPKDYCTSWDVNQSSYVGHTASVEDIKWSPVEDTVFASCSVDRSIRIWDIRARQDDACMLTTNNAHEKDVNVISWNKHDPLIVSGGDDGLIKVWDLRNLKDNTPVAIFSHHKDPITSVEWHPSDSSVFAASGADDQLTIWDLAVEDDTGMEDSHSAVKELPSQLLFIHQGQTEIKELHWHPQIPGVIISTASDCFNVFKTISV